MACCQKKGFVTRIIRVKYEYSNFPNMNILTFKMILLKWCDRRMNEVKCPPAFTKARWAKITKLESLLQSRLLKYNDFTITRKAFEIQ